MTLEGYQQSRERVRAQLGMPPVDYDLAVSHVALTEEAQLASDSIQVLTDKLLRDVNAEDRRMRSEVLPEPPEGYYWQGEMQTGSIDYTGLVGEFRVKLLYRLRLIGGGDDD